MKRKRCGLFRNTTENSNTGQQNYWIVVHFNIGIKHGFSCINIRQVPWEVLKTEAEGRGFQHLPRDLANFNALKNMFDRYYCIKLKTFATFRVIYCTILFRLLTDVSRM